MKLHETTKYCIKLLYLLEGILQSSSTVKQLLFQESTLETKKKQLKHSGKMQKCELVGGWTNPSEKIWVKMGIFPKYGCKRNNQIYIPPYFFRGIFQVTNAFLCSITQSFCICLCTDFSTWNFQVEKKKLKRRQSETARLMRKSQHPRKQICSMVVSGSRNRW